MTTFIDEIIDNLLSEPGDVSALCIVSPSRRAGVILRKSLQKKLQHKNTFLPQILSIEELIEKISGLSTPGQTYLQITLYKVYKDIEANPDSFLEFLGWSNTLLADFNEIDRYLLDRDAFFNYLTAVKKLNAWNIQAGDSRFVDQYLSFWQAIKQYYYRFFEKLNKEGMGYQGMLYRKASEKADEYLNKSSNQYVFMGFNALNTAEQKIIQKFLESGRARIFWELDNYFYQDNQLAVSRFVRQYFKEWPYYKNHPIPQLSTNFNSEKVFTSIAVPQQVGQVKYIGGLLRDFSAQELTKTAIVLGDESLLLPLLNSLPANVENINVTMGLPLAQVPDSAFFESWISLHLNTREERFFYKNILSFLSQEHTVSFLGASAEAIKKTINSQNLLYISYNTLAEAISDEMVLKTLFEPWDDNPHTAIDKLLDGTRFLQQKHIDNKEPLRLEYLNGFLEIFNQLKLLLTKESHIKDIKTLYYFYLDILKNETLDLRGDPYTGLQIMGVLESRVLDFETVIITSLNEGTLPSGKSQNSFIPFDMKKEFVLPTYREKDAIYAYHFFRLLQRAQRAFFLYNNVADGLDSGEKSRFLLQLETDIDARYSYREFTASAEVTLEASQLKTVEKTPKVVALLHERAAQGFSPSGLSTYIRNPIDFYNRYVLGIKELDEVEDTVAHNTLGTIVHDSLEALYTPHTGKILSLAILDRIEKNVEKEVTGHFGKAYSAENIKLGMNLIIYNVALQFVRNFIAMEREQVKAGDEIIILDLESDFKVALTGTDYPVKLRGKVDRVDRVNGQLRIVDYKTGKVLKRNLNVNDWDMLFTDYDKYSKPFQVLCYALMLKKSGAYNEDFLAGIISFKNMKEGFLPFTMDKNNMIDDTILYDFEVSLTKLIDEICSPAQAFIEKEIPMKFF
ncbi:MAG: hypothetical protein CL868_07360 [Cytophagaceae bacterium]|nr:hypothetical protein [Cytophagaceae bacterium]|tara:strand:+ start:8272 stop:10992 length:2721 start_codon:yes stop_codon:yes gene_type:complete